jgi:hypothetical protein
MPSTKQKTARKEYCFGGQRMKKDRSRGGWKKRLAGPGTENIEGIASMSRVGRSNG